MPAYVIVEMEVKDPAAKDRYSQAAGPIFRAAGGEFVATGAWQQLAGAPGLRNGAVIRFEDRTQAIAWYESPEYQATISDRDAGMICRFHLIG